MENAISTNNSGNPADITPKGVLLRDFAHGQVEEALAALFGLTVYADACGSGAALAAALGARATHIASDGTPTTAAVALLASIPAAKVVAASAKGKKGKKEKTGDAASAAAAATVAPDLVSVLRAIADVTPPSQLCGPTSIAGEAAKSVAGSNDSTPLPPALKRQYELLDAAVAFTSTYPLGLAEAGAVFASAASQDLCKRWLLEAVTRPDGALGACPPALAAYLLFSASGDWPAHAAAACRRQLDLAVERALAVTDPGSVGGTGCATTQGLPAGPVAALQLGVLWESLFRGAETLTAVVTRAKHNAGTATTLVGAVVVPPVESILDALLAWAPLHHNAVAAPWLRYVQSHLAPEIQRLMAERIRATAAEAKDGAEYACAARAAQLGGHLLSSQAARIRASHGARAMQSLLEAAYFAVLRPAFTAADCHLRAIEYRVLLDFQRAGRSYHVPRHFDTEVASDDDAHEKVSGGPADATSLDAAAADEDDDVDDLGALGGGGGFGGISLSTAGTDAPGAVGRQHQQGQRIGQLLDASAVYRLLERVLLKQKGAVLSETASLCAGHRLWQVAPIGTTAAAAPHYAPHYGGSAGSASANAAQATNGNSQRHPVYLYVLRQAVIFAARAPYPPTTLTAFREVSVDELVAMV
jgi:hypothetical protein